MAVERVWDGEEAFANSKLEALSMDMLPDELAERYIKEYAPMAAQSLAHLAMHASDERIRMNSAKYIVDHTLRIRAELRNMNKGDALADFLMDVHGSDRDTSDQ